MAYDDEPEGRPRRDHVPSAGRMSKTPSWIMLGFVLGALFVWALGRKSPPPPARPVVAAPAAPRDETPRAPPALTTIEAVFEIWKGHAVWSDGTTEVALWNPRENAFSDLYEIRRYGNETYYFRTIPHLTRRIIKHGKPLPESPLLFTETEEQYDEWRKYGRHEQPLETPFRPPAPAREGVAPVDRTLPPAPGPVAPAQPEWKPAIPSWESSAPTSAPRTK